MPSTLVGLSDQPVPTINCDKLLSSWDTKT
jgi:hypothetical protein